ncbi:hypothetical protein MJM99_34260, partial [Salmonella enterica subsp. enterica serovar Kentucky]|nr:hypothetical protein [Salmonella enterica subsp. enterica serovar Kentucky]
LQHAVSGEKQVEETLVSHLLKSNCLITHQPDWGSIQIQYRGRRPLGIFTELLITGLQHLQRFADQLFILNDHTLQAFDRFGVIP